MPSFLPMPAVAAVPFAAPPPYAAEPAIRRFTVAALLGFEQISTVASGPAARCADGSSLVLTHAPNTAEGLDRLWGRTDAALAKALQRPGAVAAAAVWCGPALQMLVLGPGQPLAEHLAALRPGWAWMGIGLPRLLREMRFRLVCPPARTLADVARDVSLYRTGLVNQPTDVLTLEQAQALRTSR